MNLPRLTLLLSLALSTACSDGLAGIPCGGNLQVDAQAVLPDTGLGAGGQANIAFREPESSHSLDESPLIVWTVPPADATFADSPPRVRILTDEGRVFLDAQSTPAYRGSWYVRQDIAKGAVRDDIVSAFQSGRVVVEFSGVQPVPKVTRVRPTARFAGRAPVATCL